MSSELDTATDDAYSVTSTPTRARSPSNATSSLENDVPTRSVFFFFFLSPPFRFAPSPRYPRIIPKGISWLCMDNNGRLYAPRVAISMRDRDRCAPRLSAPGRSCAPLTAIICKNYGVRRLVGGRLAEAPSRRSSRRHTIRGESKRRD